MVSRAEYIEQLKPKVDPARQQLRAEFTRAALDAAAVTGIPQWDTFCTYVQGWVEQLAQQNDAYRQVLERETLVDAEEIARLRLSIIGNNIRIDVFRKVMAFPRNVVERAQEMEKYDG